MYPSYDHGEQMSAAVAESHHYPSYNEDHNMLLPVYGPNHSNHPTQPGDGGGYTIQHFPEHMTSLSTATGKTNCFSTEPDRDSEGWRRINREDWTANDVFHWIATVSHHLKFSYEDVNASGFCIDGASLLSLTRMQFLDRDSQFGGILYDALHRLPSSDQYIDHLNNTQHLSEIKHEPQPSSSTIEPAPFGDSSDAYDYQPGAPRPCPPDSDSPDEDDAPPPPKKGKRPPGRPPGAKARAKAEKKTGRLWEFIRNLLHNPEFCPSVICWEDHDEGVFRFVKSERVAKIWGKRKNNEKMNYEKLSRAMRYYYKSQVFLPVLGRKLVYKFGPNAKGWRSDNPNFRLPPPPLP